MSPHSPLRYAVGFLVFVFVIVIVIVILGWPPAARATGKEQVLYSFQGLPDGSVPVGGVAFDKAGNLYGVTTDGGSSSCGGIAQCGTVYELQPPTQNGGNWTESVLYVFQGKANNDGETPAGGVIVDKVGNIYGTTAYGGTGDCILLGGDVGCGTVYEITPPTLPGGTWTETVIYSFQGGSDGYVPTGNLVFDSAGNLYGATSYGGGFGTCNQGIYPNCGTIFELSPPKIKGGAWEEKVLYSFRSGTDGANPNGNLVFDGKGALYGTTMFGGNQNCEQAAGVGCGTVFRLNPPMKKDRPWDYEPLYRFNQAVLQGAADGENPGAGVVLGKGGTVFGTTLEGGLGPSAWGTLFELKPSKRHGGAWVERIIYSFSESGFGGYEPGGVVIDKSENLYGAAHFGGTSFAGTIFRLKQPTKHGKPWAYTVLYNFLPPPDGVSPIDYPIIDDVGNLHGITQQGGDGPCQGGGCGTVFELTR